MAMQVFGGSLGGQQARFDAHLCRWKSKVLLGIGCDALLAGNRIAGVIDSNGQRIDG